ncbi:MAG: ankyrin repeat domain-containing protein [Nevskiales bacterium]
MKNLLIASALASVLLAGCAQQAAKPDATPAAAADGLSQEDRIAFFVNHARSGEIDAVKQGLVDGIPVNGRDSLDQTALLAAISSNSLPEVQLLLAHGADVDIADNAGWTPLHYAAWFGSSSVVLKELLDHGAKIDARNGRGITALYFASVTGHEAQVKLLLERGADRTLASNSGYTALRAAKVKGLDGIVALLDPQAVAAPPPPGKH